MRGHPRELQGLGFSSELPVQLWICCEWGSWHTGNPQPHCSTNTAPLQHPQPGTVPCWGCSWCQDGCTGSLPCPRSAPELTRKRNSSGATVKADLCQMPGPIPRFHGTKPLANASQQPPPSLFAHRRRGFTRCSLSRAGSAAGFQPRRERRRGGGSGVTPITAVSELQCHGDTQRGGTTAVLTTQGHPWSRRGSSRAPSPTLGHPTTTPPYSAEHQGGTQAGMRAGKDEGDGVTHCDGGRGGR